MKSETPVRLAYFISSHGYGHAARAAAIMQAIERRMPGIEFIIFSETPAWFFKESLPEISFEMISCRTDVGFVQIDSLREDLPATLLALDDFLPLNAALLDRCARSLVEKECRLALCDLAPLGVGAARVAGVPSLLVENFTWDWIYAAYEDDFPDLRPFSQAMQAIFADADFHVQTRPICRPDPPWPIDRVVAPVSRVPRETAEVVRERLGVSPEQRIVLITMGGIVWNHTDLDRLAAFPDLYFVVPGGASEQRSPPNVCLLSHRSGFYHPDLVCASRAVIGKIGYSTLAEVYRAGVPFAAITRARFPESARLARFVEEEMQGIVLNGAEFESGAWLERLPDLLARPIRPARDAEGADEVAGFVISRMA